MELLLIKLLEISLQLETHIVQDSGDEDGEQWISLLEERQQLMDEISERVRAGEIITDYQKEQYLLTAHKIDQKIIPHMKERMSKVHEQINKLQQVKRARNFYGEKGYSAFGAFFDKKK